MMATKRNDQYLKLKGNKKFDFKVQELKAKERIQGGPHMYERESGTWNF